MCMRKQLGKFKYVILQKFYKKRPLILFYNVHYRYDNYFEISALKNRESL